MTAAEREAWLDRLCAQDDDPADAPQEYWDPESCAPPPGQDELTADELAGVREAAGDEGRHSRDQHIGGHREPELATRPAELIDHRAEGEPDGEASSAADEENQKAGGKRERSAHSEHFPE